MRPGNRAFSLTGMGDPHLPRHRLRHGRAFGLNMPRVCARLPESESGGKNWQTEKGQETWDAGCAD